MHACRLKGGRCNCDNILQGARGVTAWVPFALGVNLQSFTGMSGYQTIRIPSRQRHVPSRYSRDVWLLLFILSLLLTGTDAARGHASHGAPGMYASYGDEAPWTGRGPGIGDPAILDVHDAAAEILPPPPPPSSSDESSESSSQDDDEDDETDRQPILFRVFGYGYPGEYIALGFIPGPTMDYAIRQLYADSVIAQSSSPGRFIPLQAEPITEACHAMWLPHWAVHATGRLAVIDLEQVSHGSFVHYFESHVINLDEVRMALSHIWRQGWEVFVPSYGNLPLENDMQVTIDHGTTIYIQDDWFLPIFHHSSSEDFLSIAQWGADVAADGVPPDTPWGPEAVQVICEGQSCLFEHVADETDLELLGRIQEVLRLSMDSPMLVRPSYQPRLPTFGGIALSEILCLLPYGLKDTEVVVFLDKRKACQGWDAVHLASPQIPNADMVDILQLQIPRVFGYKLHIEGGRAFPDFLQVSHGQILEIEIVPETDAFDYEGCEEEDDCDSSDTELDPNTPDGRWCDDHSRGRPPSDHHGDGSYLVVRHQRHEDRPRSRSRSPFGGNTQT